MSSQTQSDPREMSELPVPSPLLSDVPLNIERDGDEILRGPPERVASNIETEPPTTVLDNPLIPASPSEPVHVTECHTIYSIFMACITNGYTSVYAYYAYSSDEKVYEFWSWIILSISVLAMAISFFLKPRREDLRYKIFLYFQYFGFAFISDFLAAVGDKKAINSFLRCLAWFALFLLGMRCRSHVAKLTDEDLSKFLSKDVIRGGVLIGLAQLVFLMFGSIQCDGNADDWRNCNRTLLSQTGLSGMVMLYTVIMLISGVVPTRILDKHVISLKRVVAMNMNSGECVQAFGLAIATCCGLYLFGNYGADGDFRNYTESYIMWTVMSVGCFSLVFVAVWNTFLIRAEMRSEEESRSQTHQGQSSPESFSSEDGLLVEASSFWFYCGVLATFYFSAINIAAAVTMDTFYISLTTISLPFVVLIYIASVLCQPKRRSSKDMWKLTIHAMSFGYVTEAAMMALKFRSGAFIQVIVHFFRCFLWRFCYNCLIKLREVVARLPDEDLETFLADIIFKGGYQILFSILFLTFRTTQCMFEKNGEAECRDISWCSTCISIFILILWVTKIVQKSVKSEWQKELNLSIEQIARMRGISMRVIAQGALTLLTGVCGIFLFSMMSADEMNKTTIVVAGFTGIGSSAGVFISELYSNLKAQRRMINLSESGEVVEQVTMNEEPVEELSWFFVVVSFLFTSTYSVLYIYYGVTLEARFKFMANIILPIVCIAFVMSVTFKPKRTDTVYMRFLCFHFCSFTVIAEISYAIGTFRLGEIFNTAFAIFRIPPWCLAFWLGLKLRESIAKLPPQELSDYLCQTVLTKSTAAMGTMLFFSFEAASCFISRNSLDDSQCSNTSNAAMCLSVYLAIFTAFSIASKAVPRSVQRETAWELTKMATLKGLKRWQRIQGGLMSVTALASLYLLSVLGVQTDRSDVVWVVGFMGILFISLAFVISEIMLVRLTRNHQRRGVVEMLKNQRSVRGISSSELQDGMFAAALV
mmetsp:Transcript_9626/g.17488  ORF Transcript_9626/g.17488 Transcript_9626/m.17488 type:complete len:986 (+) Transcript_9626:120-3077(+)